MTENERDSVAAQYAHTKIGLFTPLELQQICIQRKNIYTDALMAGSPAEITTALEKHFYKAQELYRNALKRKSPSKAIKRTGK